MNDWILQFFFVAGRSSSILSRFEEMLVFPVFCCNYAVLTRRASSVLPESNTDEELIRSAPKGNYVWGVDL